MSKQVHDLFDDEVTTGATLDSGTTIGGNKAYHFGNDGQGSGLDAETVNGKEIATTGETYTKSTTNVLLGGTSPATGGIDQSEFTSSVWVGGGRSNSIYELDLNGNIQKQFSTPCEDLTGLALDADNDSIWYTGVFADSVFEINQNGTIQSGFNSPGGAVSGIATDSSNSLWVSDSSDGQAFISEHNRAGTQQDSFNVSDLNNIAVKKSNDSIFRVLDTKLKEYNQSGAVQRNVTISNVERMNSAEFIDGDSLWVVDNSLDSFFKLLPQNSIINLDKL